MDNQGGGNAGAQNNAANQQAVPFQTCKLKTPRDLIPDETRESLTSWIDVLQNYLLRDVHSQRFLTNGVTWNVNQPNYGLVAEGPGSKLRRTAPEMEAALREMFRTISGFSPHGFLKRQIPLSTSFQDIIRILYEVHNLQLNSSSLMLYDQVVRSPGENPYIYFARLIDHFHVHLAPANATGGGYTAGPNGDTMSLSQANMVAIMWMEKIDRRLLKLVRHEYARELREGTELVALVSRIAANMDDLLVKLEETKVHRFEGPSGKKPFEKKSFKNWRGGDDKKKSGRDGARGRDQLHCPHCKFLAKELEVRLPYNHSPTDCTNKKVQVRRVEDEAETSTESETENFYSEQESDGEPRSPPPSPLSSSSFQTKKSTSQPAEPPPIQRVLLPDSDCAEVISALRRLSHSRVSEILSEDSKLVLDAVTRIKQDVPTKAKSASILGDYNGTVFVNIVDGGAEINCLDLDLVERLGVPFVPTDAGATAAGEHKVALAGVTSSDFVFSVDFHGRSGIPIDMQRAAVVRNLGADALLGEPAKRRNKLDVVSHQEIITIRYDGKVYHKGYHTVPRRKYRLARVRASQTIFPGESWRCPVPRGLRGEVFLATTRRGGTEWFEPGFYSQEDGAISLKNILAEPVSLKRKEYVVEVRSCSERNLGAGQPGGGDAGVGEKQEKRKAEKQVTKDTAEGKPGKVQKVEIQKPEKARCRTVKQFQEERRLERKKLLDEEERLENKIFLEQKVPGQTEIQFWSSSDKNISRVTEALSSQFRYKNFRNPEVEKPTKNPVIDMDPDGVMPQEAKDLIQGITDEYYEVFTKRPGKYNGAYGKIDNSLQFATQPTPNLNVYQPSYSEELRKQMGDAMDALIDFGVLQRPEDVGVTPEVLCPSLMVPKTEPGQWRIVTDLSKINQHIKKYPSTSPTLADTKKLLARKNISFISISVIFSSKLE